MLADWFDLDFSYGKPFSFSHLPRGVRFEASLPTGDVCGSLNVAGRFNALSRFLPPAGSSSNGPD
jgi:hypothetical protein